MPARRSCGASLAMPDIHQGYGLPVGGVVATDAAAGGVVSPGGVGYDINCGVRLIADAARGRRRGAALGGRCSTPSTRRCPTGVGARGRVALSRRRAASASPRAGRARGRPSGAAAAATISRESSRTARLDGRRRRRALRARARARPRPARHASARAITSSRCRRWTRSTTRAPPPRSACVPGQVTVMIHTGSRGLGHQVMHGRPAPLRSGACAATASALPDRQLACAPAGLAGGVATISPPCAPPPTSPSPTARCSRRRPRRRSTRALGVRPRRPGLEPRLRRRPQHRQGGDARRSTGRAGASSSTARARRAPSRPDIPSCRRTIAPSASPCSFPATWAATPSCCSGRRRRWRETFGSTCHGAGRLMSRTAAVKAARGRHIAEELAARGVLARATGRARPRGGDAGSLQGRAGRGRTSWRASGSRARSRGSGPSAWSRVRWYSKRMSWSLKRKAQLLLATEEGAVRKDRGGPARRRARLSQHLRGGHVQPGLPDHLRAPQRPARTWSASACSFPTRRTWTSSCARRPRRSRSSRSGPSANST